VSWSAFGLLLGMALPYFAVTVPATITKWLLFRSVFRRVARANAPMLCAVAIAEPICLHVALRISFWLNISGLVVFLAYGVLALFFNLLLFPSDKEGSGISVLRKCLYAFALGLIYLLWLVPVAFLLSGLIDGILTSSGTMQ
jgi:hypothetical protein